MVLDVPSRVRKPGWGPIFPPILSRAHAGWGGAMGPVSTKSTEKHLRVCAMLLKEANAVWTSMNAPATRASMVLLAVTPAPTGPFRSGSTVAPVYGASQTAFAIMCSVTLCPFLARAQ
jgi:hypothetical protein